MVVLVIGVMFSGRKAFLKLAAMARCKKWKAAAASALGIGVLVGVSTEIDFLLQSMAEVRVSGHRGRTVTCLLGPLALK